MNPAWADLVIYAAEDIIANIGTPHLIFVVFTAWLQYERSLFKVKIGNNRTERYSSSTVQHGGFLQTECLCNSRDKALPLSFLRCLAPLAAVLSQNSTEGPAAYFSIGVRGWDQMGPIGTCE